MKMFVNTLSKNQKTTSQIYRNPIKIPIIRKNQFPVLRSLEFGKIDWFWQFCKDSKPLCGFSSWYIAGLLFSLRLLAKIAVFTHESNELRTIWNEYLVNKYFVALTEDFRYVVGALSHESLYLSKSVYRFSVSFLSV